MVRARYDLRRATTRYVYVYIVSPTHGRYTEFVMKRVRLTPSGEQRVRSAKALLYIRWMPHLGAEPVALYELLHILAEIGRDHVEAGELAELLMSTPDGVERSLEALVESGFAVEREGWLEIHEQPPIAHSTEDGALWESSSSVEEEAGPERAKRDSAGFEVIRAEPAGVSADDYFKYMGRLPAPHIIEFLNAYCHRDGMEPDVVREALKIASERDARRVGYVRSILERWVERRVKTVADVERFEKERKLRLVEQSGASYLKGGALKIGEEVNGGTDRQAAARHREGYEWLFGE